MKRSLQELSLHVVVLVGGLVLGWVMGHPLAGVAGAAVVLLARETWAILRVQSMLHGGNTPPTGLGPLTPLAEELAMLRRKLAETQPHANPGSVPILRRFVDLYPEPLILLDRDLRIVALNDPVARLLHLDGQRDRGQRLELLIRHPDFLRWLQGPADGTAVDFQRGGGQDEPLRAWLLPIDEAHHLLLIRSLADPRRLEQEERLFLSNASHELRTPATVIFGHLELLRDHPALPPSLRPQIDSMYRESMRMNQLLRNLLELLRLDATAAPAAAPRPVMVASLVASLEERARGRGCLVIEAVAETDAILGNELDLSVAFWNLVDNAFKFGPPDGEVRIRWQREDEAGAFIVSDRGPGIAPEDLPRLGERFYRAPSVRAAGIEGSGLGLAIVRAILERHGARLEIDSRPGEGTRMICHFPPESLVHVAAEAPQTPVERAARGAHGMMPPIHRA